MGRVMPRRGLPRVGNYMETTMEQTCALSERYWLRLDQISIATIHRGPGAGRVVIVLYSKEIRIIK
jgi:hypothetical protein